MEKSDVSYRFHQLLAEFSELVNHEIEKQTHSVDKRKNKDISGNLVKVQPLERYLSISKTDRQTRYFKSIKVKRVVIGKVVNILGSKFTVRLLAFADKPKQWVRDLKINMVADLYTDLTKQRFVDDFDFEVGDIVQGIVIHITTNEVLISFNEKLLEADQHVRLGKIDLDEEDSVFIDSEEEDFYEDCTILLKDLRHSKTFANPSNLHNLTAYFGINLKENSFVQRRSTSVLKEDVDLLREKQSYKWSMEMVGIGVKHFREKEQKEAMKCFDQAITFFPKNVEAFVARGALKANRNDLQLAINDFKEALRINPKHRNGRKYLTDTLTSMAQSLEKDLKWKEASRLYKEILEIDNEHKEAIERSQQIKQILSQKIISGKTKKGSEKNNEVKIPKTLSESSKDRISKLRKLLEASRSETSSSSTSTSSSSSDSSFSSSEDDWVEKKPVVSGNRKAIAQFDDDVSKTLNAIRHMAESRKEKSLNKRPTNFSINDKNVTSSREEYMYHNSDKHRSGRDFDEDRHRSTSSSSSKRRSPAHHKRRTPSAEERRQKRSRK